MSLVWARRVVQLVVPAVLASFVTVGPLTSPPAVAASGPYASVTDLARFRVLFRSSVTYLLEAGVGWPGRDQGAQLASFDVRVARTPMTSARRAEWRQPGHLQGLAVSPDERRSGNPDALKKIKLRIAKGQVLCVSTRATDTLGNVGEWTEYVSCLTRFLDDKHLARRGQVQTVRNERYWGGAGSSLGAGDSLVLRKVPKGAAISVLWSRTGKQGEGMVAVRVNGVGAKGPIRLCELGASYRRSPHRQSPCGRVQQRRGPIRFVAARSARDAAIEGVAVTPDWAH